MIGGVLKEVSDAPSVGCDCCCSYGFLSNRRIAREDLAGRQRGPRRCAASNEPDPDPPGLDQSGQLRLRDELSTLPRAERGRRRRGSASRLETGKPRRWHTEAREYR